MTTSACSRFALTTEYEHCVTATAGRMRTFSEGGGGLSSVAEEGRSELSTKTREVWSLSLLAEEGV